MVRRRNRTIQRESEPEPIIKRAPPTEYIRLGDLHAYEFNPRDNERAIEALKTSLQRFGWQQPIVIDDENIIIAGHTRHAAALSLTDEDEEAPCWRASDLTEDEIRAFRVIDNKFKGRRHSFLNFVGHVMSDNTLLGVIVSLDFALWIEFGKILQVLFQMMFGDITMNTYVMFHLKR